MNDKVQSLTINNAIVVSVYQRENQQQLSLTSCSMLAVPVFFFDT